MIANTKKSKNVHNCIQRSDKRFPVSFIQLYIYDAGIYMHMYVPEITNILLIRKQDIYIRLIKVLIL